MLFVQPLPAYFLRARPSRSHFSRLVRDVFFRRREAGLPRDSVIDVSQLLTLDKASLTERIGQLSPRRLQELEAGLRLALAL